MESFATIAIAVVVFFCAAYVAWKITWLLLKLVFWLIALAAIVVGVWWFTHQTTASPRAPAAALPAVILPAQS